MKATITCDNCEFEEEYTHSSKKKLEIIVQSEAASHIIEGDCPYGSTNTEYDTS